MTLEPAKIFNCPGLLCPFGNTFKLLYCKFLSFVFATPPGYFCLKGTGRSIWLGGYVVEGIQSTAHKAGPP